MKRGLEKQNMIRYLEMLSTNVEAANILTNGSIMPVLVKMLRQSKASALRVQLASLLGLLIRHSTYIDDELSNSGILGALNEGLIDRQEKVRRFSMAALGELLFYISTQNDQSKPTIPPESPSKETKSSSGWQVNFLHNCYDDQPTNLHLFVYNSIIHFILFICIFICRFRVH